MAKMRRTTVYTPKKMVSVKGVSTKKGNVVTRVAKKKY